MNRPYRTADYRQKIATIREAVPGIAISTDLMVGFPGETPEQFEESLDFCDEMKFASMHIFKYSPRTGTPAAGYPNQVSNEEKDRRSHAMQQIAVKNQLDYMKSHIGTVVEVLAEEKDAEGCFIGHTDNYLHVRIFGNCEKNRFVKVLLDGLNDGLLEGKIVE